MDQLELAKIKARNERVEKDKAWETSWTRRLSIFILTYAVIVIFFKVSGFPDLWFNAAIPAIAFLISTLTLSLVKDWWLGRQ